MGADVRVEDEDRNLESEVLDGHGLVIKLLRGEPASEYPCLRACLPSHRHCALARSASDHYTPLTVQARKGAAMGHHRLESRSVVRVCLALALGWLIAACGSNSMTEAKAPVSIVGNYNLTTFDGKPLPKRDSLGPSLYYETRGMKLTLLGGGSWNVQHTVFRVTGTSEFSLASADTGTWILSGSALRLVIPLGQPCGYGATCTVPSSVTGTWSGNTITLVPDSASGPAPIAAFRATLVFARQ